MSFDLAVIWWVISAPEAILAGMYWYRLSQSKLQSVFVALVVAMSAVSVFNILSQP